MRHNLVPREILPAVLVALLTPSCTSEPQRGVADGAGPATTLRVESSSWGHWKWLHRRDQGLTRDLAPRDSRPPDRALAADKLLTPDRPRLPDHAPVADSKVLSPDKGQALTPDKGTPTTSGPTIAGCPTFPADNEWNKDISTAAVDPSSATIIATINQSGQYLHPDFSSTQGWNPPYGAGIPYLVVAGTQPKVCMSFQYASESDPGPYPIPASAPIEGGPNSPDDRHVVVIDKDSCKLYETYWSFWNASTGCWTADSGAVFNLKSNLLRPDCWTSSDAAGLPVFAGLVRYDEAVTAGQIRHALRVTFAKTRQAFVHPATHFASSDPSSSLPAMGQRLRLKASYDISGFTGAAKAVLVALKKYGMLVADNGSSWFISGAPHASWDDSNLNALKQVPGTAFEVLKPMTKVYTASDCP